MANEAVPVTVPVNDPVNDPVVYDAVNALNDAVETNEPVFTDVPAGPCAPCGPRADIVTMLVTGCVTFIVVPALLSVIIICLLLSCKDTLLLF